MHYYIDHHEVEVAVVVLMYEVKVMVVMIDDVVVVVVNEVEVMEMMKAGAYFYKHDFGRQKRSRKQLKLSNDGLKLTWKSVGANEGDGTDRGGSPSVRGVMRSASFSRSTSSKLLCQPHTAERRQPNFFIRCAQKLWRRRRRRRL